jgi:general secretion pathway protein A
MYYEYWGLKKPPFDNVPDPSMYVESHASVENTITETLFAIEEGNECIAVIIGDVGLGKTLCLRLILDNLSQDKYKVAFITNPDMSFVQLMREIVGQLTGQPCEIHKRIDLLETFNKIIFQTADEGKKVLLFIDEGNALPPGNLESLRLLTNMQEDHRNLFTIVMAGQIELARRLEHPHRANLFQRIGMYCSIDKIQSPDLIRDYVETRLRLAGGSKKIFTDDAIDILWEYSEHGVPRLINKFCKLCLKAGETNGFENIGGLTAKQMAERFQKLTRQAPQKRIPRKRLRDNSVEKNAEMETPDHDPLEPLNLEGDSFGLAEALPDYQPLEGIAATEENEVAPEAISEPVWEEAREPVHEEARSALYEEAIVGKFKIKIDIPLQLLKLATSSTRENRARLAGRLAGEVLDRYPQLTSEPAVDAIPLWSEIRSLILNAFEREIAYMEAEAIATAG